MKALVLAGGEVRVDERLRRLAQEADWVVSADSGLRHAAALGVIAELVVGDFDSVSADVLSRYPGLPQERHPADKDSLDLELALSHARTRGAAEVAVIGGLGGRLDQTLAAVLIAARAQQGGLEVILYDEASTVRFVAGGGALELTLPEGTRFSVLSLSPASTVSLTGARFPLEDYALEFGLGLGVSNESAAETLSIRVSAGLIAVIVLS
ncbi:thiamine diphosphokinase [soil metagenome]